MKNHLVQARLASQRRSELYITPEKARGVTVENLAKPYLSSSAWKNGCTDAFKADCLVRVSRQWISTRRHSHATRFNAICGLVTEDRSRDKILKFRWDAKTQTNATFDYRRQIWHRAQITQKRRKQKNAIVKNTRKMSAIPTTSRENDTRRCKRHKSYSKKQSRKNCAPDANCTLRSGLELHNFAELKSRYIANNQAVARCKMRAISAKVLYQYVFCFSWESASRHSDPNEKVRPVRMVSWS